MLTTYLSLAGRYCVLMPNSSHGGGISRKINSASDRKRLKGIIAEMSLPKSMGCIVRTAGLQRTKIEDIRAMSPDQMDEAVLNLKKERFNLRFQRATGQLENTSRLREARRDIARIKTVAAQKRDGKKK